MEFRFGKARVDAERLIEVEQRALVILELAQGKRSLEMQVGIVGVNLQRALKMCLAVS